MVRSISIALALALAFQGGQAAPTARVDDVFKEFTAPGSPGCTAGVYQGNRIVHKGAYGMANLDHDVPLTPAGGLDGRA